VNVNGKALLFWLGAVLTLAAPLIFGLTGHDAATSAIVAASGIAVMVLTKIEDLVEISFGPLSARMRETIREAAATIEQLRSVATAISQASLTDMMAGNFMGGTTLRTRMQLRDRIIQTLRDVGVSEAQVSEAESEWRKGISLIYHRVIRERLEGRSHPNRVNTDASGDILAASREFQSLIDFSIWRAPTPEEMTTFLAARGLLNEELQEWIDDYRHYLTRNEIRRLDTFLTTSDPPKR
jgi:hypothetical protein